MAKHLYVIAGPNGAGKTTFAREFLPNFAHCEEFVNVDLIASGLSPFSPEKAAIRAGRLMLKRIRQLSAEEKSFGFETTLSGQGTLIDNSSRQSTMIATGSSSKMTIAEPDQFRYIESELNRQ